MRGVFNGHPVDSANDLIRASQLGSLHLHNICGEPKRYVYREMGKLAYSREEAAKWFAEQLGVEAIEDLEAIREEVL